MSCSECHFLHGICSSIVFATVSYNVHRMASTSSFIEAAPECLMLRPIVCSFFVMDFCLRLLSDVLTALDRDEQDL